MTINETNIKKIHYKTLSYFAGNYKDVTMYKYQESDAIVNKNGQIELVHGGDGYNELFDYLTSKFPWRRS